MFLVIYFCIFIKINKNFLTVLFSLKFMILALQQIKCVPKFLRNHKLDIFFISMILRTFVNSRKEI